MTRDSEADQPGTAANAMHPAARGARVECRRPSPCRACSLYRDRRDAVLALPLAGAPQILWEGLQDWSGTTARFNVIDQLLFVLMMVEILHAADASIRTGTIVCEPFLIVGLIACIRRVLVITLGTSQTGSRSTGRSKTRPCFMPL